MYLNAQHNIEKAIYIWVASLGQVKLVSTAMWIFQNIVLILGNLIQLLLIDENCNLHNQPGIMVTSVG